MSGIIAAVTTINCINRRNVDFVVLLCLHALLCMLWHDAKYILDTKVANLFVSLDSLNLNA
ncbi:hypothetical protein T4D_12169 [Trichinella pseudospiralis]|uniref:Uncharacterized protein n=1 Tax=Trichinella pseudospiralis TaxID=6337 RepID=A0A0V1FE52_TRIPS|nr:hypothetical protein T4D_12169 [Trichinella pseudospiralis]